MSPATSEAGAEAPGYPRWVVRAPGIGAVLCLDAAEERSLLEAFAAESAPSPDLEPAPAPKPPKAGKPR